MRAIRAGLAIFVAISLAACQGEDQPERDFPSASPAASPTGEDSLVVALVGTTSGSQAWRGDTAFRGADLGVHRLNQRRAEGDPVIELVTLDDGGDPATATALVEEVAASDRTLGVVYAGPPEGLPPAERALADAGIPAFIAFGDLYGARKLSPHVFQVSPPYLWQARSLARYLTEDRRYRLIGSITSETLSGEVARNSIAENLFAAGQRPAAETYQDRAGLTAGLREMKRRRVEAIVVEGSPDDARAVLAWLDSRGASYRSTALARTGSAPRKKGKTRRGPWRPQVVGFDAIVAPTGDGSPPPPGTVGAETYARGAHYLPIPSFETFRSAFRAWWEDQPLGWEHRAYEAVQMIGWAADATDDGEDAALALETLREQRFGGLDVTFGPDDHTSVGQTTVGLWVVPRPGAARESRRLPETLPWVPLGRGFSIDGEDTDFLSRDWRYLFPGSPRQNGPAPKLHKALFGVVSKRSDPVH